MKELGKSFSAIVDKCSLRDLEISTLNQSFHFVPMPAIRTTETPSPQRLATEKPVYLFV